MTHSDWQRIKDVWCERCRHNSKRKPCPAIVWMDKDPNDAPCTRFISETGCLQYQQKPEPKSKKAPVGKRGRHAKR